ncbi:MAG: class II glutamine amidotransferase [Cycloclasticus sp.]|nr:class II glutamine amidotransferase [Cycloclasticus sp.]MBG96433.1 class II glutamine amidotransferase [Cycloclasticus sp.]HAI97826.1 class II glutamine amidotransferase [Methylococcaceae bacterium]|tara:strand:- start:228 stop:1007 length:780 start_codon:yes stop_codon:yes gene_type:complete
MCELLGMSANVPTDICFSFSGLIKRGGETGSHKDGWGIAFYEGKGYRSFHDPVASANSEVAKFIQQYSIKSTQVICHIRKANRGRVCLENTHPFSRELWGQIWSFAHNGQLKGIKKKKLNGYTPVGTTDSEHAFCWILGQLRQAFPTKPKSKIKLRNSVERLCREVAGHGVFNVLMSDAENLYVYCNTKLSWLTRQAPFVEAQLVDADLCVDFKKETAQEDVVTVIATEPLTSNEQWAKMAVGEFSVFRLGEKEFTSVN